MSHFTGKPLVPPQASLKNQPEREAHVQIFACLGFPIRSLDFIPITIFVYSSLNL